MLPLPPSFLRSADQATRPKREEKKSDSLFYFLRHLQLTRHLFTPYERAQQEEEEEK